jgi:hypothetical protein
MRAFTPTKFCATNRARNVRDKIQSSSVIARKKRKLFETLENEKVTIFDATGKSLFHRELLIDGTSTSIGRFLRCF